MRKVFYSFLFISLLGASCNQPLEESSPPSEGSSTETTYSLLPTDQTNIHFTNKLEGEKLKSPLQYINVYNGGGVALGDINNDGLVDVYLTGNISDNRLYVNKGNFAFEEITAKAGVACSNSWSTGVSMIDINQDGWLDIYVCRGYYDDPQKRKNQLFINNKDLTFTEMGSAYGLGDIGFSIQATFFDYNKDGLVDVFVGNHPRDRYQSNAQHYQNWLKPSMEFSDHLYHNNGNGTFTDVTTQSGILNYGWTLGMVSADLNQDDWPDLYVTVDHLEPDRLYINNKNGTFSETSRQSLKHMSLSAMGVDAGDINNDGLLDVVTAEMLAFENYREKTQMPNMNVKQFWDYVIAGYNYQYMRNSLHVNNGNGTFRETGQLANIHKTDWSWATLFMDMDNDGLQDLFIANGYFKDYSDKDYQLAFNAALVKAEDENNMNEKLRLYSTMAEGTSPNRLPNFMFKNNGDLTFEDYSQKSGLDEVGFSTGAAYADLDNDGDLDMIVNNIGSTASVFRNNISEQPVKNNWIRLDLEPAAGQLALGAKIWVTTPDGMQFQEHTLTRGYQSSVENIMHFGLGKADKVNEVRIQWPNGKQQTLKEVPANQVLTLKSQDATEAPATGTQTPTIFADATASSGIDYIHEEVYCPDYEKQVLLPHQMSCFGPALSVADINNDGLEDFYVGGAQDHSGAIYVQNSNGQFTKTNEGLLQQEGRQEDLGSALFDADGDGDPDLYVTSGGNEFNDQDNYYTDRFYLNDGKGNFTKSQDRIPAIKESGSCVKPFDFDGDGDLDLFVGSRHIPGKYPMPPRSYLLENNGGFFKDITKEKAPHLLEAGMITDAMWVDLDKDDKVDLFLVGEWMPLTFLIQKEGGFEDATETFGLSNTRGWWNHISTGDYDGDGDMDYALGNLGLNYKYKSDLEAPFQIYGGDFDENGTSDIVLGYISQNTLFPLRGRQCSSDQIPDIAEKFPDYEGFGNATLSDVYGDALEGALHYEIHTFKNSILFNLGNGNFELKALPNQAQASPVNGIISKDFDNDGNLDLLMAGNLYVSEVETGRADSGIGYFLKGDGKGSFTTHYFNETGFFTPGDVKDLKMIKTATGKNYVLVANNHSKFEVFEWLPGNVVQ
jgi:hypothetical protein